MGLPPVLSTFCSHLHLLARQDGVSNLKGLQTWLAFRKESFLCGAPQTDDLASLFRYQLYEVVFDFMSDFLQRSITLPPSPTLMHESLHHDNDGDLGEELDDERKEGHDIQDPVEDHFGVETESKEEEEEEEKTTEDELEDVNEEDLLSRHLSSEVPSSPLTFQPM